MKKRYFTKFEIGLWIASVSIIVIVAAVTKSINPLTLIASIIGATFLILNAKGNVWGQILTVVFSVLYGIISYKEAYYGEMITYLGMTAPIAAASVVTWIKNPSKKGKNEVEVNHLKKLEYILLFIGTCLVTFGFYFILKYFNTAVLWLSTLSVFTSFAASYLTMRRSEYFALLYASNDAVLIGLWIIASMKDKSSFAMIVCFLIFLFNDLYGFYNWKKLKKKQNSLNKIKK